MEDNSGVGGRVAVAAHPVTLTHNRRSMFRLKTSQQQKQQHQKNTQKTRNLFKQKIFWGFVCAVVVAVVVLLAFPSQT